MLVILDSSSALIKKQQIVGLLYIIVLIIATKYKIKFDDEYSIKTLKSKINEIKKFDIRKKSITVNAFFN